MYCYNRDTNPFLLSADGLDFSSNEYGLYATGAGVRLSRCTAKCSRVGFQINGGTSVDLRNCSAEGSGESPNDTAYGFYISADRTVLRDCNSKHCRIGFYVINQTEVSPDLTNIVSDNTSSTGLYMRDGNWSWGKADGNVFTNTIYAVQGYQLNWTIDGIEIDNSSSYGIADYNGNLEISNSAVSSSVVGVYCNRTNALTISNSKLSGSTHGILSYYTSVGKISGLTATENQTGVTWYATNDQETCYVENSKFIDNTREGIVLQNTPLAQGSHNLTFQGNLRSGLRLTNANLEINAKSNFLFSGNDIGLYVNNGTLAVSDMSFADNRIPIYFYGDRLELDHCNLDAETYGVYAAFRKGCRIHDCDVQNAQYGLYLNPFEDLDDPIEVSNVSISNAVSYGIYAVNRAPSASVLELSACNIQNCGEGIRTHTMQSTIQHCSLANLRGFAIRQVLGSTQLSDTTITGSRNYAVHATGERFDLNRVVIADSNYGPYLTTDAGTIVNSVIKNCNYGLYLNGAGASYQILQSTIANITYYGIWHYDGDVLIRNSIIDAGRFGLWKIRENGTITHEYNLVYSPQEPYRGLSSGPGEINKAPVFANVQAGDIRLAAGSPAINAGMDLSTIVNSDIEGNKRPSYRRYEMGAYEYMEPSGSLRVLHWDEVAR
ncbi:MAG: NosD domain-containing protein [Pirellulaceae bacterium]